MILTQLLILACILLCLGTVLPMTRFRAWWVRIWDFPRLQLASLLVILLLALFWGLPLGQPLTWMLLGVAGTCLAIQLWWIIPYSPLYRREVHVAQGNSKGCVKLFIANVLMSNRNAPALVELIRRHRPDIVITLETDLWWQRQLDALSDDYPYALKCPQDNLYGMHLYSRLPLKDEEITFLVESDVPSIHARITLNGDTEVDLHCLHPAPPSPTENDESTERDVELLALARQLDGHERPVIVAGDLNDVAWSRTTRLFRKVSGLLDPRVGRGMYNSFHADYRLLRWPLDHLFHSKHFGVAELRCLKHIGSDHFPLLVELCYLGDDNCQEGLEADAADRQEAAETVREETTTSIPLQARDR